MRRYNATNTAPALTILDCASCGLTFAITQEYEQRRRQQKDDFYCPNGHKQGFYGPNEQERRIKELEAQLKREQNAVASERSARSWAESRAKGAAVSAGKAKAAKRRIEERLAHGVCPCCHRTFKQLAAHMQAKHPEYGGRE